MTIADYVILAVIALSALIGLFRGFFREALSLAAWVVAFVISFRFGPWLAEQLAEYVSTPSVRLAGAYAALFVAVLIIGAVINFFVGKLVKGSGFAGTDKILGLVFGGARGVVLVLVFIMLASMTVVSKDPWYQSSAVIGYLSPWAERLKAMLPEDMDQYLDQEVPKPNQTQPPPTDSSSPQE